MITLLVIGWFAVIALSYLGAAWILRRGGLL